MTGANSGNACPTLKDILGERYARRLDERLESLKCDKVKAGEEAIIASATFKEQDARLAAGTLPTVTAAVGAILSTYGDSFSWLTLLVTAIASIVAALLLLYINVHQQTQAVATKIIYYRLEKGDELRENGAPTGAAALSSQ